MARRRSHLVAGCLVASAAAGLAFVLGSILMFWWVFDQEGWLGLGLALSPDMSEMPAHTTEVQAPRDTVFWRTPAAGLSLLDAHLRAQALAGTVMDAAGASSRLEREALGVHGSVELVDGEAVAWGVWVPRTVSVPPDVLDGLTPTELRQEVHRCVTDVDQSLTGIRGSAWGARFADRLPRAFEVMERDRVWNEEPATPLWLSVQMMDRVMVLRRATGRVDPTVPPLFGTPDFFGRERMSHEDAQEARLGVVRRLREPVDRVSWHMPAEEMGVLDAWRRAEGLASTVRERLPRKPGAAGPGVEVRAEVELAPEDGTVAAWGVVLPVGTPWPDAVDVDAEPQPRAAGVHRVVWTTHPDEQVAEWMRRDHPDHAPWTEVLDDWAARATATLEQARGEDGGAPAAITLRLHEDLLMVQQRISP